MLKHRFIYWLTAGVLVVASCTSDRLTSAQPRAGQGMLAVRLTDGPTPLDSIKEVNVFVERIDARRMETDSDRVNDDLDGDDHAEHDSLEVKGHDDDGEHADSTEWVTIATPNQVYNLLALQNGVTALLGATPIDTGHFRSVRLIIDPSKSNIVLKNGTVLTTTSTPAVEFESNGRHALKVELEDSMEVAEGSTTTLTIDLKLGQSLTLRSNSFHDGVLFHPVVSGKSHRH